MDKKSLNVLYHSLSEKKYKIEIEKEQAKYFYVVKTQDDLPLFKIDTEKENDNKRMVLLQDKNELLQYMSKKQINGLSNYFNGENIYNSLEISALLFKNKDTDEVFILTKAEGNSHYGLTKLRNDIHIPVEALEKELEKRHINYYFGKENDKKVNEISNTLTNLLNYKKLSLEEVLNFFEKKENIDNDTNALEKEEINPLKQEKKDLNELEKEEEKEKENNLFEQVKKDLDELEKEEREKDLEELKKEEVLDLLDDIKKLNFLTSLLFNPLEINKESF